MSERIRDLKVEHLGISTLKPYARNARTHTKKQIRQIAASIETFGWTNPLLIDQDRQVVAGHGRLEAAKLLGLEEIPAIRLSDLTEAQVQAYVIADNRLAELAGWDEELLSIELKALCEIELDFDIEVIGFNTAEIDGLVLGSTEPDDDADRVPEIDADAPAIAVPGDLWQLGKHRLLCGDARDPRSFETLLDGELAQMVFTDPPYNVPIDGNVCGLGRVRHKEFAMASGEMSEAEFSNFLETVLQHLCTHSCDRRHPLHLHGLAPRPRAVDGGAWRLHRAEKHLHLEQDRTAGWVPSIGPSTSSSRYSRPGPGRTSTTSISAPTGATARTSGTMPGSTYSAMIGTLNWPCTRQSNRSPWSRTPFSIARAAVGSCSTLLRDRVLPSSPPNARGAAVTASRSTPDTSTPH